MSISGTNCEVMCEDSCDESKNGICNDGGVGSVDGTCATGNDCADCGARVPEGIDCYFQAGARQINLDGIRPSGGRRLDHNRLHSAIGPSAGRPTNPDRESNLDNLVAGIGSNADVPDSHERDGMYKSFRAGNTYKLVLTFESGAESWDIGLSNLVVENYDVEIKFWANGDRLCTNFTAQGSGVWEDRREVEFQMPDLLSEGCSGDVFNVDVDVLGMDVDVGFDFHEYRIEVATSRGNHRGYSETFRMLYEKGLESNQIFKFPDYIISDPDERAEIMKWEWRRSVGAGTEVGLKLECKDCYVALQQADVHVLV